ncbi:MAG TPA: hypothetical protein VG798_06230, partial [Rhizomicrobium sp.]|nr:hypothetical protein [Rhizomicrobium sp.]
TSSSRVIQPQRRSRMNATTDTYLAVFLGNRNNPRMQAWMAMPEAERKAKERDGIAAWKAWMQKHQGAIAYVGGPLGKTKKIGPGGVEDISNAMSGFVVLKAPSAEEAARLFEKHPHFTNFPGDSVEVMPVLPIPAG